MVKNQHPPKTLKAKKKSTRVPLTLKRHILPPVLGVLLTVGILVALNGGWLVAQVKYRVAPPVMATVSADTTTSTSDVTHIDPHAAPQITIPKIGVKAPVVVDESSYVESKIELALRRGPVHYGSTAMPGQVGNVVIIGHSSGQLWAPGDYKFVFTLLDKLAPGDTINIGYKGTLYKYQVTDSKVIKPTDFSVLEPTTFPQLTLITCTPVGTSTNRLVVHAKQISPNPATATPIDPSQANAAANAALPR